MTRNNANKAHVTFKPTRFIGKATTINDANVHGIQMNAPPTFAAPCEADHCPNDRAST